MIKDYCVSCKDKFKKKENSEARYNACGNFCRQCLREIDKTPRMKLERPLPPGVARNQRKFIARIQSGNKRVYLGIYDSPEEASESYQQALAIQEKFIVV